MTQYADDLDVNVGKLRELEKKVGLGEDEKPNLDETRRATQAAIMKMAEAGLKHGMRSSELRIKNNQCLLMLYTFGPEGTWIKGLISGRRKG